MPANPVEAGKKGGKSRSPAKLAAARRNGFQKFYDTNADEIMRQLKPQLLVAMDSKDADAQKN